MRRFGSLTLAVVCGLSLLLPPCWCCRIGPVRKAAGCAAERVTGCCGKTVGASCCRTSCCGTQTDDDAEQPRPDDPSPAPSRCQTCCYRETTKPRTAGDDLAAVDLLFTGLLTYPLDVTPCGVLAERGIAPGDLSPPPRHILLCVWHC
jgi:hypothetical protein